MKDDRIKKEIKHFSKLKHIWWGARTVAGQLRYDLKAEKYKKLCKPQKNYKILEIGCGDGEFTRRIAHLGGQITATDITPEVLKRGRKENKFKNVKYVLANAEKLKFSQNTFDIVCGVSILHHIDTEKSIKEMYRVLKKGGKLFFTEPNLLNPNIFIGLNTPRLREKMEYSPDEIALTRFKTTKMLKNAGFRKFKVENYDFLHPFTPENLINVVKKSSDVLEKIPIVKEISGSLIVWAAK